MYQEIRMDGFLEGNRRCDRKAPYARKFCFFLGGRCISHLRLSLPLQS